MLAQFRGWAPIIAVQLEYSLLERTVEGELIPMAQGLGMGVMPWGPLKSGFLSGKFSRRNSSPVDSARTALVGTPSERDYDVIDVLEQVAEAAGVSPAAVAIAWVHSRPGVSSTLIGARRLDQLRSNFAALELTLTAEQLAALDAVSTPALNFPADNNRDLAPLMQFAGATVDGQTARPVAVAGVERRPLLMAAETTTVTSVTDVAITFEVNGQVQRLALDARVTLLDALRDRLGLTGTKKGCDQGACGACTVLLDGKRVVSCLTLAAQCDGRAVTTIEGLAGADGGLHPMQEAFIRHDAFQCGVLHAGPDPVRGRPCSRRAGRAPTRRSRSS